jgi:hypothetical protein
MVFDREMEGMADVLRGGVVTFAKLAASWSDGVTRGVVVMVGVVEGGWPGVMEAVCCKVEFMEESRGGRARINICSAP